ncbi:unnamed protein product, partial [Mesorhabditis spiculigera]
MMQKLFFVCCLAGLALAGPGWGGKGRGGGGKHGGRGGRGGPMLPFLRNVTEEQRTSFFAIVRNDNLTKADVKTQTEQWAANIGGETQTIFTEFEANMTKWREEAVQNRTNILNELPAQLQKIQAIQDDQTLTRSQERQQIQAVYQNITDFGLMRAVKFFSGFGMKPHGPHGGPKGFKMMGKKGGPMMNGSQENDDMDMDSTNSGF